jgi:hypothetical protein
MPYSKAVVLLVIGVYQGKRNDRLRSVLLFALGTILFAVRGYSNTGDKAVAWALIFVAMVAIGIEAIVYFMGPKQPLHLGPPR